MKKERTTPHAAQSLTDGKGSKYSHKMQVIIHIFMLGGEHTAVEINHLAHTNDARKAISVLRADGWDIVDRRLAGGCKAYRLKGGAR